MNELPYEDQEERCDEIMSQTNFTEDDFLELVQLKDVVGRFFFGQGSQFAEGAFRHLLRLRRLTELDFNQSIIAQKDLTSIGQLKHLTTLAFTDCPLTDEDVKTLGLPVALQSLFLRKTQITDAALKHFAQLPKLKILGLEDSAVTDKGLAYLRDRTSLQVLFLSGTAITDRGLSYLQGLTSLQSLTLCNTAVTNAGILQLAVLPRLTLADSDVEGTDITSNGLQTLFQRQQEIRKANRPKPGLPDPAEVEAARHQLQRFFATLNEFWKTSGKWIKEDRKQKPDWDLVERLRTAEEEALGVIAAEYCVDPWNVAMTHVTRDPEWEAEFRAAKGRTVNFKPYYHPDNLKFISVEAKSVTELAFLIDIFDYDHDSYLHCRFIMKKKEGRWLVSHKNVWDGRWKREPF